MVYGKPSRYATASDWANSSISDNFLLALAPTNSILEIGVWVNRYENGNAVSVQAGTGFTAGEFRYLAPDTNLAIIA
uniref:hypothetical protein n=1 Tax=Roseivirga sp. TaxID=1964215 RepID=UPI004047F04D